MHKEECMLRKREVEFEWQLTDAEVAALKTDQRLARYVGRLEGRGTNNDAAHTGRRKLLASLRLDRQIAEEIDKLEAREGDLGTRESMAARLEELEKLQGDQADALRARDTQIADLRRQLRELTAAPAMAESGEPTGR
jgi:hypothetical protein